VWVALARVGQDGKPDTAGKVLDEAQKKVGNTVELRLARAGLLLARAQPVTPADLDALAAGTENLPAADRYKLLSGLGQAAGRLADRAGDMPAGKDLRAAALKLHRAAADAQPRDLAARAALLDQGLAAGDQAVVERALNEMAAVEGDTGPVGSLGRIAIGLPAVRKMSDPTARAIAIRDLRKFAENVEKMRPGWSRVFIALGQLDELEGLNDKALENYVTAINRGERQEYVVRRAIDMCRVKRQDDRARALLNQLSLEMRLPDDLERYRSIHNMLAADLPAKEKPTVDRIAPVTSTDYRVLLLRGHLLAALRDDAGALDAFTRADGAVGGVKVVGEPPIPNGQDVPETWYALVGQLMKSNPARAREAVEQAVKALAKVEPKADGERAERAVALGQLFELINDYKTTQGHLVAAHKIAPLELDPVRQLVEFLQRTGQPDEAKKLLDESINSAARDVQRWARRHYALTLMTERDAYKQVPRALDLVQKNLDVFDARFEAEDRKARATIQTVDPATRDEGIRTLREYGARNDLTPHEFYLLGRLAFDSGKYPESVKHFELAARVRPGVTAEHMAGLVRALLALNNIPLAEAALDRLKHHNPTSWEATREEARVLGRKSKVHAARAEFDDARKMKDAARAVIVKFPGWDSQPYLASRSGPLFDEIGLTADAEAAFKKYMELTEHATSHLHLAVFYIRHKESEKAIALARSREKTAPVLVTAQILSGAVRAKRPDAATEAQIAMWLDEAQGKAGGNPEVEGGLIGARAELYDAQAQGDEKLYDKAIKEYERAMAKHKSDRVVNNLCMLMVLKDGKNTDEAIKLMTELIGVRGPQPGFLDTRAVAYILSGRGKEAIQDLKIAQVQSERAVYHYHMGWALDLDREYAKSISMLPVKELERAKELGITAADLHPLEKARYTELMRKHLIVVNDP
jgi:tetratricopeptide (TPR) repeat protein